MFGSIILDIVIGLVFVYLLYSLLATIIAELVASWLGIRARMLRQAIERMLNDRYYEDTGRTWYQKLLHPFAIFVLYEFGEFRNSMAGRFYQQPSVKYLAKGKTSYWGIMNSKKPSYIRPENFSETLIQMLKSKGAGDSDMQKIGFSLRFNSLEIQPNSLKQISNLYDNAGGDLEKFREKLNNWYNEMMERLSGWFKRKIQFVLFIIGLIMAVMFNVDSISIARMLSKDKAAREQLVQMAISASDSNSSISRALKQSNDSTLNDSLLQESYRQVKQASEDAGMVLGLGWNLDRLSKVCRNDFPNSRVILWWNYSGMNLLCGKDPKKWDADSLRMVSLNLCMKDSLVTGSSSMKKFTGALNYFGDARYTRINRIMAKDQHTVVLEGHRNYYAIEKVWYVLRKTFSNWLVFLGFVITALAISLGSNFWFDLLGKLVSMRSAGVKPPEKSTDTSEPATAPVPEGSVPSAPVAPVARQQPGPAEDLITELVGIYSEELLKIAGVRAVFKGTRVTEGVAVPCIRVNVTDEITKTQAEKKIGEIPGRIDGIPVDIVVAGRPHTHQGGHSGQISNKSGKNGTGSIGCIVQHKVTLRNHVLSCWHVLKGDLNYDADDPHTMIVNHVQQDLAVRWAGGIDQSYDFGFARCLPGQNCNNDFLREAMKFGSISNRPVTDKDINAQTPVRYYDSINGVVRTGKIYAWCPSMVVSYPDKPRNIKDILVVTDDSGGHEQTISQSGNSGSLIFDNEGFALGMIIAGDDIYSYAVKLSNIFNLFPDLKMI